MEIMTEDELILTHILQCSRSELYLQKPQLNLKQQEQLETYKARRQKGEPLQYILGVCNFMGLDLQVDPRVLVPRPETEVLVEQAIKRIKHLKNPKILDLGTGSGNIAIALAHFCSQAHVVTADISADAIEVAKINAKQHGVEKRIKFIQVDVLASLRANGEAIFLRDYFFTKSAPRNDTVLFDLIISNPPYIPTGQISQLPLDVQQEPRLALEAGVDGLRFYGDIIKHTPPLLRGGAYLMMEFGDNQGVAVKDLAIKQQLFSNIQILQDLADKDRILCVQKI